MPLKGVKHELAGRALENALEDVAGELALGFFRGLACFINVGALVFVSAHGAFCGHDLQKLQDGGVAQVFFLMKRVVDFADGGRAACPEDLEDFEFGCCGLLKRFVFHGRRLLRRNS